MPYEILPPSEMPFVINPASGYIANANNDPIGSTFDNNAFNQMRPGGGLHYLSFGYSSLRMGRIDRELQSLIGSSTPITPLHMKTLQANTDLLDAELVFPYLDTAFSNAQTSSWADLHALGADTRIDEAIKRLQDWDYSTPTGLAQGFDAGDNPAAMVEPSDVEVANSVAATIWALWRGQAVRNSVDATLSRVGLGSYLPGSNESYVALKRLLERYDAQQGRGVSGLNFFAVSGAPNANAARDYLLLKSLADALDLAASPGFAAAFGGFGRSGRLPLGQAAPHRVRSSPRRPVQHPRAGAVRTDQCVERPARSRASGRLRGGRCIQPQFACELSQRLHVRLGPGAALRR